MEKWALMEVMRNHEGIFENVSDKIWEFAEIRYHEFQSADLLCQTLKEAGFQVTRPIAGIETAFVGEFGSGKPVIGFLGEFDALPNLSQKANLTRKEVIKEDACGHGCGHNLLGVGSLEAACAVKKMIEAGRFHGTVRYYGCPAEESGAGKGFMVRAGVFHDVDICLTWHPTDQNGVMQNALANMRMFFEFYGISAHAGAKPYMGRSALDAVELTNVGCNYLREHIIPEARLHYAVTNTGGTAPNIVQAYAEEIYCIRAPKLDQLEEIFGRVCNVARGAALMTDTRLNIRVVSAYANLVPNKTLSRLAIDWFHKLCPVDYTEAEYQYARQYQEDEGVIPIWEGVKSQEVEFSASTDVGDVSWNIPTLSITAATMAFGTALHSWKATAQGKSSVAKKGMHLAAQVLAAVAVELYENQELVEEAKDSFRQEIGNQKYKSLIPEDVNPGDF